MKAKIRTSLMSAFSALAAIFLIAGCSSGSNSNSNQNVNPYNYGTAYSANCTAAGSVYSSTYGCLKQGSCMAGQGMYGGQCINVTSTIGSTGLGYGTSSYGYGTASVCGGSCPAGYTQTSYGCLPQYSCQSCYGYYSGYCLPGPQGGSYYYAPY